MIKSMKYEFRKNRTGLLILAGIYVLLEIIFLACLPTESETLLATSILGFAMLSIACQFYIFFNGISMYSRDLREKSGYLVFMTPLSTYRIIGAKLLAILIESLVVNILLGLTAFLDGSLALHTFADVSWKEFFTEVAELFSFFIDSANFYYILTTLLSVLIISYVFLYTLVTVAYLSISLSATVLMNRRGRGLASFALFLVLMVVIASVINNLPTWDIRLDGSVFGAFLYSLPQIIFMIVAAIAAYFGSAILLDKAISL